MVADFGPSEMLVEEDLDVQKAVEGLFSSGMKTHCRVPFLGVISTGMAGGEADNAATSLVVAKKIPS